MLPITFACALCFLLETRAQSIGSMLVPRIFLPPGSVPMRSFDSVTGKFRAHIEQPVTTPNQAATLTVTMARIEAGTQTVLWKRAFEGDDLGFLRDVIVSDEGDFVALPRTVTDWALVRKDFVEDIGGLKWEEESVFRTPEEKIVELDREGNQSIIRVWKRNSDSWDAFATETCDKIAVTSEMIERWNHATRGKILRLIERQKQEQLRRKIEDISPRLGTLAQQALPPAKRGEVREQHLEFLALRRNPSDRMIFEQLLEPRDSNAFQIVEFRPPVRVTSTFPKKISAQFQNTDEDRLAVDWLLAVFDRKSNGRFSLEKIFDSFPTDEEQNQRRHYLGMVEGIIRFSAPFKKPMGTIRVYLIPGTSTEWEARPGLERIEIAAAAGDGNLATTFAFTTVKPGNYFAKAVWDRRAPLTDWFQAGPGDYESAFIGPFQVAADGIFTNLLILCTNRASSGENYYAADEAALLIQNKALSK